MSSILEGLGCMNLSAVWYMTLSAIFSTAMGVSVKLLHDIPVLEAVFMRSIVMAGICVVTLKVQRIAIFGKSENRRLMLLRGVFGSIGLTCFFYCISHLKYATAVTLQYLSPLFTMLIAWALMSEKLRWFQWLACMISFMGVYLIYGDAVFDGDWKVVWGVLGALMSACAYTCVRVLADHEHPTVIMFYFPLVTVPYSAILGSSNWVWPNFNQWGLLLFSGLTTYLLQHYMTLAFKFEKPGKIAILGYLNIVFALAVGWFVFHEKFQSVQMLGFLSILISVSGATFLNLRVARA